MDVIVTINMTRHSPYTTAHRITIRCPHFRLGIRPGGGGGGAAAATAADIAQ